MDSGSNIDVYHVSISNHHMQNFQPCQKYPLNLKFLENMFEMRSHIITSQNCICNSYKLKLNVTPITFYNLSKVIKGKSRGHHMQKHYSVDVKKRFLKDFALILSLATLMIHIERALTNIFCSETFVANIKLTKLQQKQLDL